MSLRIFRADSRSVAPLILRGTFWQLGPGPLAQDRGPRLRELGKGPRPARRLRIYALQDVERNYPSATLPRSSSLQESIIRSSSSSGCCAALCYAALCYAKLRWVSPEGATGGTAGWMPGEPPGAGNTARPLEVL
eukprot:1723951-Pyramimonas_sp.AAC.1